VASFIKQKGGIFSAFLTNEPGTVFIEIFKIEHTGCVNVMSEEYTAVIMKKRQYRTLIKVKCKNWPMAIFRQSIVYLAF
jgi:hypothetical protein